MIDWFKKKANDQAMGVVSKKAAKASEELKRAKEEAQRAEYERMASAKTPLPRAGTSTTVWGSSVSSTSSPVGSFPGWVMHSSSPYPHADIWYTLGFNATVNGVNYDAMNAMLRLAIKLGITDAAEFEKVFGEIVNE